VLGNSEYLESLKETRIAESTTEVQHSSIAPASQVRRFDQGESGCFFSTTSLPESASVRLRLPGGDVQSPVSSQDSSS
jgi:hypothetical protein